MSYGELFARPMNERELLALIVAKIQSDFSGFQNESCFLKLERVSENQSQIVWCQAFEIAFDMGDFYFDTKFERACIMTTFHEGRYEIICLGFHWFSRFEVWPDKIAKERSYQMVGNIELRRMVPRYLLVNGFREISEALAAAKGPKAV